MANEIIALEGGKGENLNVAFLFPIPGGIKVAGAVPTPAPTEGSIFKVLTAQEITDLDNGDAILDHHTIGWDEDKTGATILARLRLLYAARQTAIAAEYTNRYTVFGQRFDK